MKVNVVRNRQVAGSSPARGAIKIVSVELTIFFIKKQLNKKIINDNILEYTNQKKIKGENNEKQ